MAIGQIVGQQPVQSKVGPVATGQAYAQQIAGGMPFEQVVAPGLQFSPEAPMGLTQEELDFIAKGPAPVMPVAPTIGEPVAPSIPTMPYAPVGTPMPTLPFIQRKFDMTEIGEPFEPDLDLFLRDIEERELADILEDIEVPSLFDVQPTIPEVTTPSIFGFTPPVEQPLDIAPVMPQAPIFEPQIPPQISTPVIPTNLTALPQMPYIPPVLTPSVLTQPTINVDEIVSPISAGRTVQRMPNLFNIV